jgi:flagellar hook-length control protein FliK
MAAALAQGSGAARSALAPGLIQADPVSPRQPAVADVAAAATAPAPGAASASAAAPAADAPAAGTAQAARPSAMPDAASAVAAGSAMATAAPAAPLQHAPGAVPLAGPPTAWRQTLHEALGERLRLQVGNSVEQAVIRLEPPNLGRIEIAIRHSAGTLEVSLTATHGEVVRQLNAVSDNLRNDLAGRQFSEVAVSVSQAPRTQQQGMAAFADQQGRQQRGGRRQDENDPGLALADAGAPSSTFSLNGRE